MAKLSRNQARVKKHLKIRNKISGTKNIPRLNVFKSLKNIEAQLIDDINGKTLFSSSSRSMKLPYGGNIKSATLVGKNIGAKIKVSGISKIVFDRSGYIYHGRIKALAEAVKAEGVKF